MASLLFKWNRGISWIWYGKREGVLARFAGSNSFNWVMVGLRQKSRQINTNSIDRIKNSSYILYAI